VYDEAQKLSRKMKELCRHFYSAVETKDIAKAQKIYIILKEYYLKTSEYLQNHPGRKKIQILFKRQIAMVGRVETTIEELRRELNNKSNNS